MKQRENILPLAALVIFLAASSQAMQSPDLSISNFSLFNQCVTAQGQYAPTRNITGNYLEAIAKIEAEDEQRKADRAPLKNALLSAGGVRSFTVEGMYKGEHLKICFSLKLLNDDEIQLNNLLVFNSKYDEPKKIAFAMMPRGPSLAIGERNGLKVSSTVNGPIIYPLFNSYYDTGNLIQNDPLILNDDSGYLDLFKIALAMTRS